jgi:hypothetical protein
LERANDLALMAETRSRDKPLGPADSRSQRAALQQLLDKLHKAWPAIRWVLFGAGVFYCAIAAMGWVSYGGSHPGQLMMGDGYMFWAPPASDPYGWEGTPVAEVYQYRYSPAFLFILTPIRALPWTGFAVAWFLLHIAVLLYLRMPWMIVWPGVIDDIVRGNSVTFIALACVLALRGQGWAWSYAFLTKVTPGVGVIWHLVRREWHRLAWAIGSTAAIMAIGFLASPSIWSDWIASLTRAPGNYLTVNWLAPLPFRLGAAVLVIGWAAYRSKAWLVPIGMIIGLPGLWPSSFALVLASVVLWNHRSDASAVRRSVISRTSISR